MTDIDFDELDKAVNSIMAGGTRPQQTSAPARPVPAPATRPVDSGASSNVSSAPTVAPQPSQPTSSVPSSTPAPARPTQTPRIAPKPSVDIPSRRSGRFMDVMHPSVNTQRNSTASRPVSRNAHTIEPVAAPRTTPDMSELDELLNSPQKTTSSSAVNMDDVQSPFVTDAKVAKRPLGRAGAPVRTSAPDQEPDVVSAQAEEASSDTPPPAMPAELTMDVLNIESDTSAEEVAVSVDTPVAEQSQQVSQEKPTEPEATPVQVTVDQPSAEPEQTSSATTSESTSATPVSASPARAVSSVPARAVSSVGATSIQQQYQSEPRTDDDEESGAIYDTSAYHQPLAHPEKKKSGWMWVIWVVLLLIFGAGGGAVAYFVLLQ